jgi:hypothetical protein
MPWPKEDKIRWVEQRILEREFIDRELEDYTAWLLHVRDEDSFQDVGDLLHSKDLTPEGRKAKAQRACDRVERRHPGSKSFKPTPLSECAQSFMLGAPCL